MTDTVQKWEELAKTALMATRRVRILERKLSGLEALKRKVMIVRAQVKIPSQARRIIDGVAAEHGLTHAQIMMDTRAPWVSHPRQDAMRALRDAGYSYAAIARFFGMDHTTVMYGVRKSMERETGK